MPGLNRWGFLTPVVTGADLRAIFCAISCFRGTFCAVDLRAVCFVRAICVLRGSFFFIIQQTTDHSIYMDCAVRSNLIFGGAILQSFSLITTF